MSVNYNPFSRKNATFNISNDYHVVRDQKKNRSFFLYFSILVLISVLLYINYFMDGKLNLSDYSNKIPFLTAETVDKNSAEQALNLPDITQLSQTLPTPLIYLETSDKVEIEESIVETPKTVKILDTPESKSAIHTLVTQDSIIEPVQKNTDLTDLSSIKTAFAIASLLDEQLITQQQIQQELSELTTEEIFLITSNKNPMSEIENISQAEFKQAKTKTVIVRKGDSLSTIFQRLSLSNRTVYKLINSGTSAKHLTRIKPGKKITIGFDDSNKVDSLHYNLNKVDSLIISRDPNSQEFSSQIKSKEIEIKKQYAIGIITGSLFQDGKKAGLSDAMISQLAKLFGWDIDFVLDIRKGDTFAVLFEEKFIDNKKIGDGNILSAEFINQNKSYTAIRYTDKNNHTAYYTKDGFGMRKAFLRTPVNFSRISSKFSYARKHPILDKTRAHKGVDYAAAQGTPIKSVGRGKVVFKGNKGGYGRVIIIQHGKEYSTLYAHMNSYNKKIKKGSHVKQGQIIGYVGSSGLATGPHLHYEFRVKGVHKDPLTVALPRSLPIDKKYRRDFMATSETMTSLLKLRRHEMVALLEEQNKKYEINPFYEEQ